MSSLPRRRPAPRVHQRLDAAGHEAVVHENVFVDIELGVAALEITRAVVDDAMAQREVLRTRWSPNRIGLDEAEPVERALKRGGREERARDGGAPQIVQCHSG